MRNATNHSRFEGLRQVAAVLALAAIPCGQRLSAAIDPAGETVSVYLNVEKGGNLVTGLTDGNFRLYQDGQRQPFRLEKPEEPASVALLVEYSGSSGYFLEDIQYAMQGFLKHAIEGHWYALATYSHTLEVRTDFTKQTGRITEAYSQLDTPQLSEVDTYDAIYEMLDKLGRLPGRRILVVIGSGFDTFSEHKLDDVKKKAESENVTVFVAGLGSLLRGSYDPFLGTSGQMSLMQAQAFLQMLSSKTGGFAWFPRMTNAFLDVMQGIMQSIGTQYRLVYETRVRGSGKFHKIKVEAFRVVNDKREDFKVLVREGWR